MRVRDGKQIAAARRQAGYTQYDLAALAHCTQATISALETGTMRGCTIELAHTIAKWVRRDVEELFEEQAGSRVLRVTNAVGRRRHEPPGPRSPS
jgi:DNA-binding XRE family transcriptional regulator